MEKGKKIDSAVFGDTDGSDKYNIGAKAGSAGRYRYGMDF